MECPVGKICQFKVVDTVHLDGKDRTFRKRKCLLCGRISYTLEIPVKYDENVKRVWNDNHRRNQPYYKERYKSSKKKEAQQC
jgi:transcriptional regulator NrdR family protein